MLGAHNVQLDDIIGRLNVLSGVLLRIGFRRPEHGGHTADCGASASVAPFQLQPAPVAQASPSAPLGPVPKAKPFGRRKGFCQDH